MRQPKGIPAKPMRGVKVTDFYLRHNDGIHDRKVNKTDRIKKLAAQGVDPEMIAITLFYLPTDDQIAQMKLEHDRAQGDKLTNAAASPYEVATKKRKFMVRYVREVLGINQNESNDSTEG